jgi:hypothetical protein
VPESFVWDDLFEDEPVEEGGGEFKNVDDLSFPCRV